MSNDKILVIEDDPSIQKLLRLTLETQGYKVIATSSAAAGLASFLSENPVLVLLDLGLPDRDGGEVLEEIRSLRDTPAIVVSARGQDSQKVAALDAGADDFIVKPFSTEELFARIRVALRHHAPAQPQEVEFALENLRVDFTRRRVFVADAEVHLTPIEYKMLALLIRNRGKVLTHRFIQDEVWGYPSTDDYQTLRVFMASLRRKLGDNASDPRYITTEVGVGYRFADE